MCRHDQSSSWWLVALFLLVALFSARTVWGQETSASEAPPLSLSSTPNSASTESQPTDPWESFDSAWTSLKDELLQSAEDSEKLSRLLEGLQTEASELRFSLALSIQQYADSEAARMIEREAAEKRVVDAILRGIEAEHQRDRARLLAAILGGLAGMITSTYFRTFAAAPPSGYRGLRVQDLDGDHAVEPAHVHVSPGSPFLP
ncbi:MAG: hypothetical protein KKB59_14075, partial [Spirochaetes bacterium]|nr:hypothetical protein [Spirochaetota bacterium]